MNGSNIGVGLAGAGASVSASPKVTAGLYTAGNVMGGVIPLPGALPPSTLNGVLDSVSVSFASIQTGAVNVAVFTAAPTGAFADKGAPAIAASDVPLLVGIFALTTAVSSLGTHTIYNLNNIRQKINGTSSSLFAVVTVVGTPTPASTSDLTVTLGVVW